MTESSPNAGQGVFDAYASYYDLLYRDKDYAGEAAYVHGLIQQYKPDARELIELGCGTGAHAACLARQGYQIMGIDRSEAMVRQARARNADIEFAVGDLRDFRAGKIFDVVLSLFHVMSYQTGNADLKAAMATAADHLRPGGLFIFDCWYGPGVLSDPPVKRIRRLQGDEVFVTRTAEPDHRPNENRVDVHYEVNVDGAQGQENFSEVHAMRYLFYPEVTLLLESVGLTVLNFEEWMTGKPPGLKTWSAVFVAIKP